MFDQNGRVLYVGQSGNLRARLGSYKNARPETTSRKVIRLIHVTASVRWEECPTRTSARLRENDLLRTYRPRFNSANTYPQAYPYLTLREPGVQLSLTVRPHRSAQFFGPFKTRGWTTYSALVRLLYAASHHGPNWTDFPCRLLSDRPPKRMAFPELAPGQWIPELRAFLEGRSCGVVKAFETCLPEPSSPFERLMRLNDLQILNDFFTLSAQRSLQLRERFCDGNGPLGQAELDDLMVLASE
jgi:excinuclease UvrABC nuclease subunit